MSPIRVSPALATFLEVEICDGYLGDEDWIAEAERNPDFMDGEGERIAGARALLAGLRGSTLRLPTSIPELRAAWKAVGCALDALDENPNREARDRHVVTAASNLLHKISTARKAAGET